jgi:hypothetical protein
VVARGMGRDALFCLFVDRPKTALEAPRTLKAPAFWKFSHLKNSSAPVSSFRRSRSGPACGGCAADALMRASTSSKVGMIRSSRSPSSRRLLLRPQAPDAAVLAVVPPAPRRRRSRASIGAQIGHAISMVASPDSAMNVGQAAQMADAEDLAGHLAQADAEGDAVGVRRRGSRSGLRRSPRACGSR